MALRENIWNGINALAGGKQVIWAHQNGIRPRGEYFTLNARAGRMFGRPYYGDVNAEGIMPVVGNREFTLSIERHGAGAVQALQDLAERLSTITSIDRLDALGLVVFDVLAVTDISELIGEVDWEERAVLDVRMRVRVEILDDVGLIETLHLAGSDDGGAVYPEKIIPIVTQTG